MDKVVLRVMLWNNEVGTLYWDDKRKCAIFTFNKDFVTKGLDIAPLEVSILSPIARNGIPMGGNKEKIYGGLPVFIADSLPDNWGNQLFAQWAAQQHIPLRKLNSVDRLAFIGKRAMGALEFEPAYTDSDTPFSVEVDSLYHLAEQIFKERQNVHISQEEVQQLQNLYHIGTSAGGRRPKAIIAINEETGDIRSGQASLPSPYKYYIIKFDEKDSFPFTAVEYAYYLMAREAGINMMPSHLMSSDSARHFVTQRFDRKDGRKIHTQTLAAMNPLATTYEELFDVCRRLQLPCSELEEQFRRMTFNVLAGNVDDHNKNFSFMMDTDGVWHITPAYDITFTIDKNAPFYVNRHELTIGGRNQDISKNDLLDFAKINNIKNAGDILVQVCDALSRFKDFAHKAEVSEEWCQFISEWIENENVAKFRI